MWYPCRPNSGAQSYITTLNRGNVLVDEAGLQVISIIDFGDMLNSWLIVEPAIAATYAMHGQADPLASAQTLLRGYHQTLPLTTTEISLVFDLMCMRLCMSVCICAHQQRSWNRITSILSIDAAGELGLYWLSTAGSQVLT